MLIWKENVYLVWTIFLACDKLHPRSECASPIYMWPLDAQYANAEVINGTGNTLSACASGNTGTTSGHPDLGYDAIQFYGTVDSYMDLELHLGAIYQDFSFTMFLNTTLPITGTLFHYKTTVTSDVDLYAGEVLMFGNDTHVTVTVLGEGSVDYGTVYVENLQLSKAQQQLTVDWIPLAVLHDYGSGEIQIRIDTYTLAKVNNAFMDKVYFAQPGTLRLGGRHGTPDDPFSGKITCVQLHDSKFTDLSEALQDCQPANWQVVPTTVAPPPSCAEYTGYFVLSGRDKIPDLVHAANLMTSTVTSSRQCGDLCLRTSGCVSFASNKGNNSCHLYIGDYGACLQDHVGTNYYVKKHVDC